MWVDFLSIVMVVGDKVNIIVFVGMEFIVKGGIKVWFIGVIQVFGVLWLGVNMMYEFIINGIIGLVYMYLDKVSGFGKMVVFMFGIFGGGVGQ